jgi:hypothetical protein
MSGVLTAASERERVVILQQVQNFFSEGDFLRFFDADTA